MSLFTMSTTTLTGKHRDGTSSSSTLNYTYNVVNARMGRKARESGDAGSSSSAVYRAIIIDFSTNATYQAVLNAVNAGATINSIQIAFVSSEKNDYTYNLTVGQKAATGTSSAQISSSKKINLGTVAKNTSMTTSKKYTITTVGLSSIGMYCAGAAASSNAGSHNVKEVYLYVDLTLPTYTITYSANGHGTAPASQTKEHGVDLTLQPFIANQSSGGIKSNYVITGDANEGTWSGSNGSASHTTTKYTYSQTYWNTNSAGTGTNYSSEDTYTANESATLNAIWNTSTESESYTYVLPTGTPSMADTITVIATITFNPVGGSTTKNTDDSTRTDQHPWDGGWWTAKSGGTQRTTSSHVTASETVYAHYNIIQGIPTAITTPTTSECTRSGYSLLGWDTSSAATTVVYQPGESYTPASSGTLYAVWIELATTPIHYYNGSTIVDCALYYFNDTTLEPCELYYFDGTSLIKTS